MLRSFKNINFWVMLLGDAGLVILAYYLAHSRFSTTAVSGECSRPKSPISCFMRQHTNMCP